MIPVIAIDNEPPALDIIESYCSNIPELQLLATFTNTKDAIQFLKENKVALVFLDIEMPAISGIDFKKQYLPDTHVIFTTAFSEYALEGFEVNAVDFLLKPYSLERFSKAVEKAMLLLQLNKTPTTQHITIRVDHSFVKIMLSNIRFVEAVDDYVKIVSIDQKPLLVRMSLKKIIELLPPHLFIRVHRSYVVSLAAIKSYNRRYVMLGTDHIPVSKAYEKELLDVVKNIS